MYFDPLYLLFMLPCLLLSLGAQWYVKSTFRKMLEVQAQAGITGDACAKHILQANGIHDVEVEDVPGFLSDHYSPGEKVLRLSPDVYEGSSIASIGVAAHEVGHAIQHQQAYKPLVLRSTVAPAATIGSNLGMILVGIGFVLQSSGLILVSIVLFSIFVLFTLVTLPVEFDASKRAMVQLQNLGILRTPEEVAMTQKVLSAAALTYVAAAASAIIQLLYFILRYHSVSRND